MSRDISRRVTLAWVAAASALPYAASAQDAAAPAPWNDTTIAPLTATGYGQDPDLQHPSVPWPLTSNPHQRETLRISTPWRSLRMSPDSRRTLKCCERVDLGILRSRTLRKSEQICGFRAPAIWAKIETRTGSERAWRTDSSRMSLIEG